MDAEDVDYVCTLTEASLEKAKRELNEDPKQRLGSVQALRKWIREQPQYTCRTDTRFLLTILRRAKFSQLVARELIGNMMTMKAKCPDAMSNLDLQDPATLAQIDAGTVVYPPKVDKEGRRLVIIRPGKIPNLSDPKFSTINEIRTGQAISELMRIMDENGAVNGIVLVFDFTGVSTKHLTRSSRDEQKLHSKIWQDCTPERVKAFIIYNGGPIIDFVLTLFKLTLKKKNQDRLQVHDTMESLYKLVPMEFWPTEYLPDDYTGPTAGSIQDIAAYWKNHMMDPKMRQKVLENTSDKYKLDEKKNSSADQVPQASFRKLNID